MSKRKNKKVKIIVSILFSMILMLLVLFGAKPELLNEVSNLIGFNVVLENQLEQKNTDFIEKFQSDDVLKVYFIDVGQADSILVVHKDQAMLIDAGNNEDGEQVVKFIQNKGIKKLQYVIGTHPHEDHIGGLDDVINQIQIENIYMPKIETTTKTFEDVLDAISKTNLKITQPKKGDTFLIGDAKCEIMVEPILDKENLNLSSIVIRLEFGNNSFLLMGDSETKNENTRNWPKTDVLKIGHHRFFY